jgi:hypothetical protein
LSIADRARVRLATPQESSLIGVRLGRAQPAARLADGSMVHIY